MSVSAAENAGYEPERRAEESPGSSGLDELRDLIVGPEQQQLQRLQNRLDDSRSLAQDVSRVLPDALTLRSSDEQLSEALAPAVEKAMTASVRANPHILADALFPVMGPAIRKALSSALSSMIEGLNRSLERSFSLRSINWRVEAWRTGRPFAEIVLLHTILYRVEQVFLIHRETGLLLAHVASPDAVVQDADMVSGMLSAIRDFVHDSFSSDKQADSLDTLRVGEVSLLIEQGPGAILAGVIRGTAPLELRSEFQQALEQIHLRFAPALSSFQGDAAPFAAAAAQLESCLKAHYVEKQGAKHARLWAAAGIVGVLLALWMFSSLRDSWRWNNYLHSLAEEPGIIVVSAEQRWGKHYVTGLRDPLSRDPQELLSTTGLDPSSVVSRWEPYQALIPRFIVTRARMLLRPPPGATLSFENGILYVRGAVSAEWLIEADRLSRAVPGVTLLQMGEAFDSTFERLRADIESARLQFAPDAAEPLANQEPVLAALVEQFRELGAAAVRANRIVRVEVIGHADLSGTEQWNLKLSQARAENLKKVLLSAGVSGIDVVSTGVGSRDSRRTARDPAAAEDRRVAFRLSVVSPSVGQRNGR